MGRLLANEFKLLSRSVLARTFFLLTVGLGVIGVNSIQFSNQMVLHGMIQSSAQTSLGSAQYAAVGGAAFFAMLTLLSLSRDKRAGSRDLLAASRDYRHVILARVLALLVWACLTAVFTALAGSLSHFVLSDAVYEAQLYLFSYAAILLPALAYAVLICSGLYLVWESLDVSFLAFGIFFLMGLNSPDHLLRWMDGGVAQYSDFGGIEPVARYVVYNRLFWLFASLACLLTGLLLLRQPDCSLTGSAWRNLRGVVVPLALAVSVTAAIVVHQREPYLDPHSSVLESNLPVTAAAKLLDVESRLTLRTAERRMAAEARYAFAKEAEAVDIVFVSNAGLTIASVDVNGAAGRWQAIPDTDRIRVTLPDGERAEVVVKYAGTIKVPRAGLFAGYISPQSVYLLENSYWLLRPLTENSPTVVVSGSILAPRKLTVVTPGRCTSVKDVGQRREWNYTATTTSLNLGVFAAEYDVIRSQAGELDVEFYVSSRHANAFRAAKLDEYAVDILEYYQATVGPYPFDQWPLKVVEVPLYKPGGHSSLNVVTLAEYMLYRRPPVTPTDEMQFLVHDLKLFGHELAHQWWGSGIEIADQDDWTSEGLVEYTVYRYFRENHPKPVSDFIVRSWQMAVDRSRNNYYVRHPDVLKRMRPEFAKKMAAASSATDVYNTMPLKLIKAEEYLGAEAFMKELSAVYMRHRRGVLRLDNFLAETGLTEETLALE